MSTTLTSFFYLKRAPRCQGGAAFFEAMLAIPILILMIIIVVEGGTLMLHYLQVPQIAYEGARLASKIRDLEVVVSGLGDRGICCTNDGLIAIDCSNAPGMCPSPNSGQLSVLNRTFGLTELANFRLAQTSSKITVRLDLDRTADTVTVKVTLDHKLLWGFLGISIPISSTSTSPYLY